MATPVLVNDSETKTVAAKKEYSIVHFNYHSYYGIENISIAIPVSISLRDSKYPEFEDSILKFLKPNYLFENPVLEVDTEKANVVTYKSNVQSLVQPAGLLKGSSCED
ncbi:hypothetical protein MTR_0116s0020 [Medicago truncatula]|uniref:Uncharacterized protein n=1 Tax=Medicago truncatula TaxID=3880 RepID=A0A072TGI3_MEDTR|nr:hypothetical protein MTR_0116s0020 [Medicago truncatula]